VCKQKKGLTLLYNTNDVIETYFTLMKKIANLQFTSIINQ
jgi:hypothetical protein